MLPVFRLVLFLSFVVLRASAQESFNILNFDAGWHFHRGPVVGAGEKQFNDSFWRMVDLPHDWSIEDIPGTKSPFDSLATGQVGGGFTTQGTGWYRKTFDIPRSSRGKKLFLRFDGIYMNAAFYVNGQEAGTHPYGYTPFTLDITPFLDSAGSTVVAVEVKNEGASSRWYSGSGIYRHVWLQTVNNIYIPDGGVFITTQLSDDHRFASIRAFNRINSSDSSSPSLGCLMTIADPAGKQVFKDSIRMGSKPGDNTFSFNKSIAQPKLWSVDTPALYTATIEVSKDGEVVCREVVPFGIRSISFDTKNGFRLNGQTTKLKGGCFHNDNGPLGSKSFDRAEERRVELLKASGFNAIRCSHNPPSPAFLLACDRLGMLVIDEFSDIWNAGKNPYDYHLYFRDWWQKDLSSMILRDRNHPSIIMWSIGNEIPEMADSLGIATARHLSAYVKSMDTTRPITAAVNDLRADKDPFFAALDVAGYNYAVGGDHNQPDIYAGDHDRVPQRVMYCTESYPLAAYGSWKAVRDHPYVIGDFVWTAWDYVGEASIGWRGYPQNSNFYPWNLAFCGDIDMCGWKRPQSYYRDALWKPGQLSIFVTPPVPSFPLNPNIASWSKWNWVDVVPEWNWTGFENKPLSVTVYSSCDRVELFLNNRSLGSKPTSNATQFKASWNVGYQPGQLKAVGYVGKKPVKTEILNTPGKSTAIKMVADRSQLTATGQDLSYITVEVLDEKGNIDYSTEHDIHFTIDGGATIAGVGNANPVSVESFQQPQRRTWKGRCLLIVQAGNTPGKIRVTAESHDLKKAELVLDCSR